MPVQSWSHLRQTCIGPWWRFRRWSRWRQKGHVTSHRQDVTKVNDDPVSKVISSHSISDSTSSSCSWVKVKGTRATIARCRSSASCTHHPHCQALLRRSWRHTPRWRHVSYLYWPLTSVVIKTIGQQSCLVVPSNYFRPIWVASTLLIMFHPSLQDNSLRQPWISSNFIFVYMFKLNVACHYFL